MENNAERNYLLSYFKQLQNCFTAERAMPFAMSASPGLHILNSVLAGQNWVTQTTVTEKKRGLLSCRIMQQMSTVHVVTHHQAFSAHGDLGQP